jgi:polyhydroxyalkanoate synthesis regulator phasin
MLALGVFMLVMHYIVEPQKIIEDFKKLRGSQDRIEAMEAEIDELKQAVAKLEAKTEK